MKTKPVIVCIIDDEFPQTAEFRSSGVYNSAISKDNLYHLAVNEEWNHLIDLQQLIKDVIASKANEDGYIDLYGFNTPTQALLEIEKGLSPDIIIYDWEYLNAPMYSQNAKNWLLEMLNKTSAFLFVYSKIGNELTKILNETDFSKFIASRFQLFLKGGKVKSSFSSEEFILQYIIGAATNSGNIKINGIPIKFTSNNYLEKASDILFLQRILGSQYVIDEMNKIDFTINEASVEKILNDSNLFLYINKEKKYLITPGNKLLEGKKIALEKISYLEVLRQFSPTILEDTIERGIIYY
jgi:hypothetical protein